MFAGGAARIRAQHAMLSHWTARPGTAIMAQPCCALSNSLETCFGADSPQDLRTCLSDAGWRVLGVDGGASSSLLGTFFQGMADCPASGGALDQQLAIWLRFLRPGWRQSRKQTKAQPGDKTMMDALVPAIAALRAAADSGKGVSEAMGDAASRGARGSGIDAQPHGALWPREVSGRENARTPGPRSHLDRASVRRVFKCALIESKGESGNA